MTEPMTYDALTDADLGAIEVSLSRSRMRRALQADHYARTLLLLQAVEQGDTATAAQHEAALASVSDRLEQLGP